MWLYCRSPDIEFGIPDRVLRQPLKPHVHTNVQIMVVTTGARRVRLGGKAIVVPAKSMLVVPPGIAHVAEESGWDGFNAYIDPCVIPDPTARLIRFARLPDWACSIGARQRPCDIPTLVALMSEGHCVWSDPLLSPYRLESLDASHWPHSREGRIRKYRREAGISPHAHVKAVQLDRARQKLARGEAIASVAADLGFADQSHLGRQFRAAFGTSPGRYAIG